MDKEKDLQKENMEEEKEKKISPKQEVEKSISKNKVRVVRIRDGFLTIRDSKGNGFKIPQTKEYMDVKKGDIIEL